jgi:uncharacterized protein YbaR (Trm112 family)
MVTAAELLTVWEKGIDRAMFERALLLLEAVSGESRANLAELTIGQRDLRLLELRDMLFGRTLPCLTACPACREPLELNLDSDDLRVAKGIHPGQARHTLAIDGLTLEYRLPDSFDLSAASSAPDSLNVREIVLGRCLLAAGGGDNEVAYNALPPNVLDALATAMAEADPQSHLELALTCPSCGQNWSAVFDIVSYLWSEIQNWAMRTLREVYLLASAFGWREADILALSPLRRQLYLQSVGA